MPTQNIYELKSDFLKALANPARIEIVELLQDGKKNVSQICELLKIEQTSASKHLNILKNSGILRSEKVGLNVFYELKICCLGGFLSCLNSVLQESIKTVAKNSKTAIKKLV